MRNHLMSLAAGLAATVCVLGCNQEEAGPGKKTDDPAKKTEAVPAKEVRVGKNVIMEVMKDGTRRVRVSAYVCLRMGQLEQFLTRKRTKEHEAILAADVDARDIHTALLLAGAEAGSPVRFDPKYQPARGQEIRVLVEYEKDGKKITHPAQQWI
ncbi:MAG: YdjY domain-containing protein, partial [Gemmataceae bacterium]